MVYEPLLDIQWRCASNPRGTSRSFKMQKEELAMKYTFMWSLLSVLSLASASLSQAQQTNGDTEKAIVALEDQWIQADRTNNPGLAAPLLAEKYVCTWMDGTILNKAQTLESAKARKYTSAENEDLKVTVFGNTAIATAKYKGTGTDAGKPFAELPAGPIPG